jgi:hypothetical protein
MSRKRYTHEQITGKLRKAKVAFVAGADKGSGLP